jgi:LysM repeat protein
MSKKRKDRLLLNLLDDKKHKHRVAMVNEEGGWNQHEPNSGMARMFVFMLLIHVVVIGGIIVYDFINGDETATTAASRDQSYPSATNSLPPPSVNAAALDKAMPIEEYSTYMWRSGDSLPVVAERLEVSEEVLIKLNMLDKGAQIDQHTIIRFPRKPVVKALALNVTPSQNGIAQVSIIDDSPPDTVAAKEPNEAPMELTPPGETFTFEPTIENRLAPEPVITPGRVVQDSPPAAKPTKDNSPAASNVAALANSASDKVQEQLPEVPKAVPVPRPVITSSQDEREKAKSTPKRIADAPPAAKSEALAKSSAKGSYVVKPGDTLYRIAAKNGISVAALQKANNITKPESLRDGMKLVIPGK